MLVAGEHFRWLFRWARHFVRASHILTHISLTIPPDKFCYDPRLQMGKEGAKRLSSWRRIHFDPWVLLLQACPLMQREGALSLSYLILAQVSVFSRVFQENPTRLSEFPVLTGTCSMLCISLVVSVWGQISVQTFSFRAAELALGLHVQFIKFAFSTGLVSRAFWPEHYKLSRISAEKRCPQIAQSHTPFPRLRSLARVFYYCSRIGFGVLFC